MFGYICVAPLNMRNLAHEISLLDQSDCDGFHHCAITVQELGQDLLALHPS